PDLDAGCSLADTIRPEDVRAWRATHPDGLVVAYVNCSAAVKAEADYGCTSGNAVAVVQALPPDVPVLFVPDFFLGAHVRRLTGRPLDVWMGECHVHAALGPADIEVKRREHPDAELLVHPECGCVTSAMYYAAADGDVTAGRTHIVSTEQMMQRARSSPARRFVVATETGVLHRLRRENPAKEFHALAETAECRFMKLITLEKLRDSLRDLKHEVTVPSGVAGPARPAILARVQATAATLLAGERVALNFLQRLSGVATLTRRAVEAVAGTGARITHTRKTTPGLRALESYAVTVGGGVANRRSLAEAVL